MKKLLAILLALVMLLSLAACGEEEDEDSGRRRKKSTEETTVEAEETTGEAEEMEQDSDSPYTQFTGFDSPLIDDEYLTLTMSRFEEDGGWAASKVTAENNSNTTISVHTQGVAVNGKMVESSFYLDADKGEESESVLYLYDMEDPDDITRLSLCVVVYDAEEYDIMQTYLLEVYPQGRSAYEDEMPARKGKDEIVDEDDLYVAVQDYSVDEDGDFFINYIAINETAEMLGLSLETVSINGFGLENYGGNYVLPDTYLEDVLWNYQYVYLQELGMSDVTMVELEVLVETMEYEELYADTVTLYPEGKSKAEEFVYEYEADDSVIAETDDFKLTQVRYTVDEWNDANVFFILENKSGGGLDLYGTEMKINGKSTDNIFTCYIGRELDTYSILYLYESEMEELGIDKIENIQMLLEVRDDNYDVIYEDTVEFDVK